MLKPVSPDLFSEREEQGSKTVGVGGSKMKRCLTPAEKMMMLSQPRVSPLRHQNVMRAVNDFTSATMPHIEAANKVARPMTTKPKKPLLKCQSAEVFVEPSAVMQALMSSSTIVQNRNQNCWSSRNRPV